jgi:hypothetical protein
MMGVVSLKCEDKGDADAESLLRFGNIVDRRLEKGVAVMRGGEVNVKDDDDC